jgi:hypothetical protein
MGLILREAAILPFVTGFMRAASDFLLLEKLVLRVARRK